MRGSNRSPSIGEGPPVAVVGAGPVGLAAAAHLLAHGLEPLVLEAGDRPAAAVADWAHVRLFTPWAYNVDPAAGRMLLAHGWSPPDPREHPTGAELRSRYLLPLAELPGMRERIRFRAGVDSVRRARGEDGDPATGRGPFELTFDGPRGRERLLARAVVDASGATLHPNPLGGSGIPAMGEPELGERIAYGVPDVIGAARSRYAGRRVLVVGSGHSAMNVLQDLIRLRDEDPRTEVVWAVRRRSIEGPFGAADDVLPARAALGARTDDLVAAGAIELVAGVVIEAIKETEDGIAVQHSEGWLGPFDEIVAATGFRPDLAPLRELRLDLDPDLEAPSRLVPLIDPSNHSCATVPLHGAAELRHPEPDFYIAGMKSYGRASTFLLLTGYEQVRSIAAALAGFRAGTSGAPAGVGGGASDLLAGLCCDPADRSRSGIAVVTSCGPWTAGGGRGCAC